MFKLIVFDMDGVIFEDDNFWLQMHKAYNTVYPGLELTEKYLEKDTLKLADEVIKKLWGRKPAGKYFDLVNNARFNPGAVEALKEIKGLGLKTMILTSGPDDLAVRAQKQMGIDYIIANKIIVENNIITGEYEWALLYDEKGKKLKEFCEKMDIDLKDVVCVGDNENDVSMMEEVGLSIAFNTKSERLKRHCDEVIEGNNLKEVVELIKKNG